MDFNLGTDTMQLFIKYGTVFVGSMFKFIFGPLTGAAAGLATWETCLLTFGGMMTSVVIFSLAGTEARAAWVRQLRRRRRAPKAFTQRNRRLVRIWRRFGLRGVAFLTPLIFSPILGTILAVSFGEPPRRIVPAMFVSAMFWSMALTWLVAAAGRGLLGGS